MILLSYILFGAYALIVQIVCIREILVVFHGNELCLGLIFACWLIGVVSGAGVAARTIDRLRHTVLLYVFFLILLCLLFPLQIYAIRILRSLLQVVPGELIPPAKLLLGAFSTITPLSVLDGALFPLACRLAPASGAQSIGRMYIAEALGSMIGGITFTFFLVTRYDAYRIAALSGCLLLLTAGSLARRFYKNTLFRGKLKFALQALGVGSLGLSILYGVAFFSSFAGYIHELTTEKRWESMHQFIDLIESIDSRYEHLTLGVQSEQYALFTNGQYTLVFPDKYESEIAAHFFMTEHPQPEDVLLIGGGVEGLIEEILKHPVQSLDYVELDPKLLELISAYLPQASQDALKDPRVSLIYGDGRYVVKQTTRRYDMIILNLPDPTNAMLNRFYTLEFFQEVQRILKPGGVVITELSSSLHLQEAAANYTGSLYKTLRQIFPYVLVTPGTQNIYVATSEPDVITFDSEILSQRYRERRITNRYFSEYHYGALLRPEQTAFVESTLQQGLGRFRLNTDVQPVTYFYNLLLWTQFSEVTPERLAASNITNIFRVLYQTPAWWFFVPILCVILFRMGYLWLRTANVPFARAQTGRWRYDSTQFNCLWAIASTGFAGMALELIIIFAFQNIYGYIYQKAGFIMAMFMAGLAAGGYLSHIKSRPHPFLHKLIKSLLLYEIAMMIFAALLPFCIRFLASFHAPGFVEIIFMLLVGISGILTGIEFPLAGAIYLRNQKAIGRTAGMLNSADHIGAFCGAALVGVVFIPILGMTLSCYFISMLKLSSVIFLHHFAFIARAR